MALLNVIEYPDSSPSEMVHRVLEHGSGEFQLGDQLIVRESQRAVIYRHGQSLDVFGPGRDTLSAANLPLLGGLIKVFFVNMRTFLDYKWDTAEPTTLRDSEISMVRLRGFGTYSMALSEPKLFVDNIVRHLRKYHRITAYSTPNSGWPLGSAPILGCRCYALTGKTIYDGRIAS